jgi:hypothetical protein
MTYARVRYFRLLREPPDFLSPLSPWPGCDAFFALRFLS